MKTMLLITIIGISIIGASTFLFLSSDQQITCEQIGGVWNSDHCMISQQLFESNKMKCDLGPILKDGICHSNGILLLIESSPKSENNDDFDKTWNGPGNRHPAFLGYEIADSCTNDMIKYLDRYTNIFSNDEHLVWNQAGLPEHINKKQFDVCFEEQQKIRYGLVELELTENFTDCEYGYKAVDGVCKQLGKIREKDIPIFFEIQLMEFDFKWELVDRSWSNPDFEIEPPARVCSHIIKDNGAELYISTIWQDEYSLSDMFVHKEIPNDCVKILPVIEIAKNEN